MRNPTKTLTALAAILLVMPLSDAVAQRRHGLVDVSPAHERHGLWINLGVAAGWENYRYSNSPGGWHYPDGRLDPSFSLAVGGTVSPYLRVGGEINAWAESFNDIDTNGDPVHLTDYLVGGLITGQLYPVPRLGLFVKGGLGLSRSGESISGGYGTGETGFAYEYGAGYEIKVSRNLFLTPSVGVLNHRSTNPNDTDNLGTLHERVWTVGLALTIQPGR
jgi:hypothetical protein